MKNIRQFILMAVTFGCLTLAVSAQRDDQKKLPPKGNPPVINPGDKKPPKERPPRSDEKPKKPGYEYAVVIRREGIESIIS